MDGNVESLENQVNFDTDCFAQSLASRVLDNAEAEQKEKMLEIIDLVCYSDKTLVGDINLKELDREILEAAFEELQEYQSDEHGEEDTDLVNEGQTIVEINRIAGMDIHFEHFKPKHVQRKTRRFF
ncbi:hypothetical protein [Cohnella sp. AR92]|uniref:hypothetical protein n=1 Tax=Cohnella sp. AR92 TaxID=648716 RepID=UPI000F8CAA80|nr:hypothetical protein [Cohnella sp. AR92]RUS44917.1 hypothetical protein ELR57_21920 [Cohnella sp. AR92]